MSYNSLLGTLKNLSTAKKPKRVAVANPHKNCFEPNLEFVASQKAFLAHRRSTMLLALARTVPTDLSTVLSNHHTVIASRRGDRSTMCRTGEAA